MRVRPWKTRLWWKGLRLGKSLKSLFVVRWKLMFEFLDLEYLVENYEILSILEIKIIASIIFRFELIIERTKYLGADGKINASWNCHIQLGLPCLLLVFTRMNHRTRHRSPFTESLWESLTSRDERLPMEMPVPSTGKIFKFLWRCHERFKYSPAELYVGY